MMSHGSLFPYTRTQEAESSLLCRQILQRSRRRKRRKDEEGEKTRGEGGGGGMGVELCGQGLEMGMQVVESYFLH